MTFPLLVYTILVQNFEIDIRDERTIDRRASSARCSDEEEEEELTNEAQSNLSSHIILKYLNPCTHAARKGISLIIHRQISVTWEQLTIVPGVQCLASSQRAKSIANIRHR